MVMTDAIGLKEPAMRPTPKVKGLVRSKNGDAAVEVGLLIRQILKKKCFGANAKQESLS